MGSVKLPFTGRVYVDAPIIIYSLERRVDYAPVLRSLWRAAAASAIRIVTSEISILETLVLPIRLGNAALIADYEAFFAMPELEVWPIDREVLREGARLRATEAYLRTPDAIHAATAKLSSCDVLLTNDAALKRLPGIPVFIAGDLLGT